jgi:type I restriction enzyme M protein
MRRLWCRCGGGGIDCPPGQREELQWAWPLESRKAPDRWTSSIASPKKKLATMPQLENIEAIEKRLWSAADTLRANSNYASNEYFMPVMGLIFLRHAYSRFLNVKDQIEASLPSRGGKKRALTKEDFSQKSAIFLKPEAQFDYLVDLTDADDRAKAVITAMESIEADYTSLKGALPKGQYQELDNQVLGQLLRTLNPEELKKASGDIFGRIYEYFLTQFADQGAHDGGEFFTPVSIVSLIANVIEPRGGIVLDPACGSGGMFVQGAHIVERHHENPAERLTFYGLEKNGTTIELARMNLAVHGLEGDIQKAISYYDDPHELLGKADVVMANPPFNVDEVDADKVKKDPRLPFGLPGVNNRGKVSNANYLWISYFYSYLNDKGRAGFVMSSQSSSAGREEAVVRQKLIETGAVDVMIAIRGNFFYTRTVPCELWFLDKGKLEAHRDKVLMLDARNVYRKVTRKIFDFSPEQLQNLLSIVWLYRGEKERFIELVSDHLDRSLNAAADCFLLEMGEANSEPAAEWTAASGALDTAIRPFLDSVKSVAAKEAISDYEEARLLAGNALKSFDLSRQSAAKQWNKIRSLKLSALVDFEKNLLTPLADQSKNLIRELDHAYKLACRLIEVCEGEKLKAKESDLWATREVTRTRKAVDAARQVLVDQLKQVRYFQRQAIWLTERFPDAVLCDVPGLVKLVDRAEIAANDWSLTPGRYVGVAPEEVDEDFDFEETLRDIHVELSGLNVEAVLLAAKIAKNFEELGV